MRVMEIGLLYIPLFAIVAYADVISIGITSDTPNAIAFTGAILVDRLKDFAFSTTSLGVTNSCTILTDIRFNDFFKISE